MKSGWRTQTKLISCSARRVVTFRAGDKLKASVESGGEIEINR